MTRSTLLLPIVVVVVGPLIAWVAVRETSWQVGWKLTVVGLVLTASIFVAGLLERWVAHRREHSDASPAPGGLLEAELLESWRKAVLSDVTRLRVSADGLLEKMVREGVVEDLTVARLDVLRSRVRVGGRVVSWSEITRRWDSSRERLVLLGDPGYGKTVAALTLVKHINGGVSTNGAVAELFRLADWQRWRREHEDEPLAAWLADQLTLTCRERGLSVPVARQLIDERLVLPVLDGLDEIADLDDRRDCVRAIDRYAERAEPRRPFVLTCRAREYSELGPGWVRDEEHLLLVGLQPDQIRDRLERSATSARPAWNVVRERQAAGDLNINALLRSPLRLAITLQVYRARDPREIVDLPPDQARDRLWLRLLETDADSYPGATPEQVQSWLTWIATGLQRTKRQRFMLHELYLLDLDNDRNTRAAGYTVGLVVGLVFGLVVGLFNALYLGLACGLRLRAGTAPAVRAEDNWRARMGDAVSRTNLTKDLVFGLVGGLAIGLVFGLLGGLVDGLVFGLVGGLTGFMLSLALNALASEVISVEAPRRFGRAGPDAVLVACRVNALVVALVVALVGGLSGGLVFGLFGGLVVGLTAGLLGGLFNGLDAWLYHHWLRWRLAGNGDLPACLPEFLEWCADEERGWLRITDAYEFRHRELLDHLAPSGSES